MQKKIKQTIGKLHLWVGLFLTITITLISLTGVVLTFKDEITHLLNPQVFSLPKTDKALIPLSELISSTEKITNKKVVSIPLPIKPQTALELKLRKKGVRGRPESVFINPYDGKILKEKKWLNSFFFFNFKLHRWLLLKDHGGKHIMGITTLGFTFLLFTGLYLWWPRNKKQLLRNLKIKTNGTLKKFNYDLHNSIGFWFLIPMLIMALTGLCWSYGWYRDGLSSVLGAQVFGGRRIPPVKLERTLDTKLSLNQIEEIANKHLYYNGTLNVNIPDRPNEAYSVRKMAKGILTLESSDTLFINQYSGEILKEIKFSNKTFGGKIASLIRPLHTGEFMGLLSKCLYFIASLVATSLPLTGFLIWYWKKGKRQIQKLVGTK